MRILIALGAAAMAAMVASGCSFDVPHSGNSLTINIDNHGANASAARQTLADELFAIADEPHILASTPSQTSDFGCFIANVTGPGIVGSNSFSACSNLKSTDNMAGAGFGIISNVVTPGNAIQMDIPAGPQRQIQVYGIYPTPSSCGGATNPNGGTNSLGYNLGSIVQDITQSMSVTVGINYAAGATGTVTCANPPSLGSLYPNLAPISGTVLPITITFNGNSLQSGLTAVITDGGGNVAATCANAIPNVQNNFTCTIPVGTYVAGNGALTVTNPDNQASNGLGISFVNGPAMFWADNTGTLYQQSSSYNYGSFASGTTNPFVSMIYNLGTAATSSGATPSVSLSGSSAFSVNANFSTTGYCGQSPTSPYNPFSPSNSSGCMIEVDFLPPSPGTYTATATVNFNGTTVSRTLIGTGT